MSPNKATLFRWEIADFQKQHERAKSKNKNLISNVFSLVTCSSIQFALFYNDARTCLWSNDTYGVVLKKNGIDQTLKFDLKIWMENVIGQRFGEYSAQHHEFKTIGDKCEFNVKSDGNHITLFNAIYNNHGSMFICCELLSSNQKVASITFNPKPALTENYDQKFCQDFWTLYEEDIHDAVIKIGGKQFKVMKGFFMAHSSVFKSMFLSKFKEGVTSEVEVKDIDEGTMKHLIKWMYTNQLEKDSPIENLFIAADKYDVKILKKMCVDRIRLTLDKDNAFDRLVLASMHSDTQLKGTILDFISGLPVNAFTNFLASDKWLDFHNKNPGAAKEVAKSIREKMNA